MQEQLKIDFPMPEGYGCPQEPEPLFWVREIRLLSKWGAEGTDEIRRISLRQGLNIVWSPPREVTDNEDQRISGHASGKTTFCRMLRYVLGDDKIGTEDFRSAVTHKHPNGWIVAEVRLCNETWSVARPFTMWSASRGFAIKNVKLDEFLALQQEKRSYEDFVSAIESASRKIVPFDTLPDGSHIGLWEYFPWFTRDQEMQFSRLYAWREIDNTSLKQNQKSFVMRSVYNPMAVEEIELTARRDEITGKIDQLEKARGGFEWASKENQAWMTGMPDLSGLDLGNVLFVEGKAAQLEEERRVLDATPIEESDALKKLHDNLAEAELDFEDAMYAQTRRVQITNAEVLKLNELERAANQELTPKQEDIPESQVRVAARFYPGRRYCSVPLDFAKENHCDLAARYAEKMKSNDEERVAAKVIVQQKAQLSLAEQKQKVANLKVLILQGQKDVEESRNRFLGAKSAYESARTRLYAQISVRRDAILKALMAIERYKEGEQKLTDTIAAIEKAKEERKKVQGQLTALRKGSETSVGVSDYYFHVVRFIFGRKVLGEIVDDRDVLATRCTYNDSPCQSAAIDAALNVAFDLTVLVMGIQGLSRHPRFLVHDGPRVADLSKAIYNRYFEFAEDLERRAKGHPNFQYIITTTEPPPERFRKEPYLRLELDASTQEGRLLKCNLI